MKHLFSSAFRRITLRILLWQIFGNLVLMGIALAADCVPDSHIWQLMLTVLMVGSLVAGALALHTLIVRRLRQPAESSHFWLGGLFLGTWIALYWLIDYLVSPLNDRASQRASYWNSMLGPHLRTIFTYTRLLDWQGYVFQFIICVILPALFLPAALECASRGWKALSNIFHIYLRWQYWLVCILAVGVCCSLGYLIDWHPPSTPTMEIFSVVLRLTGTYLVCAFVLTYVLAVTAELLARNQAMRNSAS